MSAVLLVTCDNCGNRTEYPVDPHRTDAGTWYQVMATRRHWCPKCDTGDLEPSPTRPASIAGDWGG